MAAVHESLNAEMQDLISSGEVGDNYGEGDNATEWHDAFNQHPHRHVEGDTRPVVPIAVYCDGVRYTRAIGIGKYDTILNINVINLITEKRHLLCVTSKREACKCGCRGWCTNYITFDFLAWCLKAAASGKRPGLRWDGSDWGPGSVCGDLHAESEDLCARFIVVALKGDWSEFTNTFGMPTWAATLVPCVYCSCTSETMYGFDNITLDGHGWGDLEPDVYETSCASCEIHVGIDSERVRNSILTSLAWDPSHQYSRRLLHDLPDLGLQKGDRLEPSPDLRNIAYFESRNLNFTATFWRIHRDRRGRLADRVHHRNPLFCNEIGITPQSSMQVDLLHTVYLGVLQRYVQGVMWGAIDSNIWGVDGNRSAVIEQTISSLEVDIKRWYIRSVIPTSSRVNHIKTSMLGTDAKRELKLKAAETGTLVPWAVDFSTRYRNALLNGAQLKAAGETLVEYMSLLKASPLHVPEDTCQTLLDLALRHLTLCKAAHIDMVPKHHNWVHMTLRLRFYGNARTWATFLDESLNLLLANMGARFFVHRGAVWAAQPGGHSSNFQGGCGI